MEMPYLWRNNLWSQQNMLYLQPNPKLMHKQLHKAESYKLKLTRTDSPNTNTQRK